MFDFFGKAFGVMVTLLGFVIAVLVYELNRQKFRLELLRRRSDAYRLFKKVLGIYTKYSDFPSLDESGNAEYKRPLLEASQLAREFKMEALLFDDTVEAISQRLWNFIFEVSSINEQLNATSGVDRTEWLEKSRGIHSVYKSLWDDAEQAMTPYLRIREPKSLSTTVFGKLRNLRYIYVVTGLIGILVFWSILTLVVSN